MLKPLEQQADVSITELKQSFKELKDSKDSASQLRLHRSLSWLEAADTYKNDKDMCFINLWIAFKALVKTREPELNFQGFSDYLFSIDPDADLYSLFWHEYSAIIRQLIKNPYLYEGFWSAHPSGAAETENEWRRDFEQQSIEALNALSRRNEAAILQIILSRLFVLQQQVLEGGATWKSQVNRQQIEDGVSILQVLLPRIIRLMLVANKPWEDAAYPVVGTALV